jgi:hypothetical protein
MKQTIAKYYLKCFFLIILSGLVQTIIWAQDTTTTTTSTSVDVTKNNTSSDWMSSPWVWVIGGAVFILLLVALLSGRNRDTTVRNDRTTVTKTVERDSDI